MSDTATTTKNTKKATTATKAAPKAAPPKKATGMSDDHKKALAEGRQQSKAVSDYLEALKVSMAPRKRGRQRTPESIRQRLDQINTELANEPSPLAEVQLIQERIDLEGELAQKEEQETVDPDTYLDGFVEAAKPYSDRKGISYAAWRQLGVAPAILKQAGISRSD